MENEGKQIGGIGNYYGSLHIRVGNGVHQWGIENYNGFFWEDIPKSLYDEMVKFQDA